MKRILITGATGNIGKSVINHLITSAKNATVIAGVRNIEKAKASFTDQINLNFCRFDFEDSTSFNDALSAIDTVFLLRPPQISDIDVFIPLIDAIKKAQIKEIVFLSVQGADKSKIIPHNKIERLIKQYEIPHIFVRPSYFMQNLTTTLHLEIKHKRSITLPSKNAKFNWVDIEDIAASTVHLILNFSDYQGQVLDITGTENENFQSVVNMINEQVENKLTYKSVGPFKFYRLKKKEGMSRGFIMVMLMLHYLPRFQKEPEISDNVFRLTGMKPKNLKAFIQREKKLFE